MDGNGPRCLLVADVSRFTAKGAPVLGVVHVGVSNPFAAAARSYDVCYKHTDSLVGAVRLDGSGAGQSLDIPTFGLLGNDGTEDTKAELRAGPKAIFNLAFC